jgi:hypothetical protein
MGAGWGPPPQDPWGQQPPGGAQSWGQQPPGGPPPWGQPPGQWGQPGWPGATPPVIESNLVWGILTTIFCCQPLGIVSIVFAAQVGSKQAAGDYAGAMDASRKARGWAIAAAVVALFWIPLAIGFSFFPLLLEPGLR